MKNIVKPVVAILKKEPVTVWGAVIAAVLGVLAGVGVPSHVIDVVIGVLSLGGIPVVRGKVSPLAAAEALAKGAEAELAKKPAPVVVAPVAAPAAPEADAAP